MMSVASTKPETQMEMALIERGIQYEKQVASMPGKPDFYVPASRLVIFVHGCYWHRHMCRAQLDKGRKLDVFRQMTWNFAVERDIRTRQKLQALGYSIFVAWECDLANSKTTVGKLVESYIKGRSGDTFI